MASRFMGSKKMRPGPGIMSMLPERKTRLRPTRFEGDNPRFNIPAPGEVEKVKQVLPSLPPKALQEVVPKIPPEVIKQVIPSLPPQTIKEVLPLCGTGTIKEVMPTLPPEVVKEVVPSLPPETIKQVLPTLPPEVAQEVIPPRRPMDADRPIGPRPPGRIPGGQPIRIPEPVGPPPFDPNLGQPSPDPQTAVDNMGWDIPVTPPQEDWVEDFMPPTPPLEETPPPGGWSDTVDVPEVQPPTTPIPEPPIPPDVSPVGSDQPAQPTKEEFMERLMQMIQALQERSQPAPQAAPQAAPPQQWAPPPPRPPVAAFNMGNASAPMAAPTMPQMFNSGPGFFTPQQRGPLINQDMLGSNQNQIPMPSSSPYALDFSSFLRNR